MDHGTRRDFVRLAGTAGVVGLAGCSGGNGDSGNGNGDNGNGNGGTEPLSGEDYPAVDEWLTETGIGGADDTYDGTILDRRGRDSLEIGVGTEGNGGAFAFGPSAVAVSVGTTIDWVWTGEGGAHNVEALPEEQLGESDYEFSSGESVDEEGETHSREMDMEGIALYHCEPHLSLGMKGAVVVL